MIKQKYITLIFALLFSVCIMAQATHVVTNPENNFNDAKELFATEQYALAYPLFKDLKQQNYPNTISNHTYLNDDISYYYTACQLYLNLPIAESEAKHYINVVSNEPRKQLMSYHLGKYLFTKNEFKDALNYYDKAGLDNLSNENIADAKFEKAYCFFNLKRFAEAKPFFNEVHQLTDSKYYYQTNYYYGFISYYDRDYNEALTSFKIVEKQNDYKGVVPYYIAEIFYFQGKKDEALEYAEGVLKNGNNIYYEKEMKLLLGQLYFEKKDFNTALPLLEYYVNNSKKVDKEVLYEVSFCYYQNNQLTKAIEGFKQLSNQKDSLGQNSMYLLGDCYLKTNQKENAKAAFQFCANNSSNLKQQEASRFIYAKLSYELGYQDIALTELKKFLNDYPNSDYQKESKELLVGLFANTNNFSDALSLYQSFGKPTASMQKVYPRILFGTAIENINEQKIDSADELLTKVIADPNAGAILPYANFWKGEIAYRNQKFDEAVRYLTTYLQSNVPAQAEANTITAKYDMGYCMMKKENYKQALNYFQQVYHNISPISSSMEQDAYVRTADCYFMSKDFAKANTMYDNVINNSLPQSDYAFFQKAMIAGVKNSADKIKTLNMLTRQYPQSNLVPDVNIEVANTYMADEKFGEAIPYLNNIIAAPEAGGLKPLAYLKLGLSYYNINKNKEALDNYQSLIQKYPQSTESDEAIENIKSIYIQEGKPNDYVELMRKNGKNISTSDADSLTFTAAELKYTGNDCANAIIGFNNYLSQFPNGTFALEANYYKSECYLKSKDFANALTGYNYVNSKGINRFFEKATLEAARINYFELKEYANAKKYFESLLASSPNQDNQLEALRGLIRCQYLLKDYVNANETAKTLLTKKALSTDDKAIAFLVLGKSHQINNDCNSAIASFKSCAAINKSAWGAEARYEIANCQFASKNMSVAEKSAMLVIKETGSSDFWVTKSYILLGDIFMNQKDYFNAKATYESVAKNSVITELKIEAQQKLDTAIAEEKMSSKVNQ